MLPAWESQRALLPPVAWGLLRHRGTAKIRCCAEQQTRPPSTIMLSRTTNRTSTTRAHTMPASMLQRSGLTPDRLDLPGRTAGCLQRPACSTHAAQGLPSVVGMATQHMGMLRPCTRGSSVALRGGCCQLWRMTRPLMWAHVLPGGARPAAAPAGRLCSASSKLLTRCGCWQRPTSR